HWIASVDHPADKATVNFTVRAPAGRTVVANGELLGTRRLAGSRQETRWRETRPISTYLMVLAAGSLARYDLREPDCHYGDQGQCVRQTIYVTPENRHWLPGPFMAAGPIMTLFEGIIGPFPYEKLAHVQSTTRFGGMENASAIFYDGKLFDKPALGDATIAHEMAHQWFGDSVTEREWAHLWLSEGFATYFAALWTQFVRGDITYRAELAKMREAILADPVVSSRPVIDSTQSDPMSLLNKNSYEKGGYVLYMLRERLGDSVFFAGIRTYYAAHRHGVATTDDVRRAFEGVSGEQLGQYFDQWLRRPGWAEPSVGWAYDSSVGSVAVVVQQDGTRGAYELPLMVSVTDSSGAVRQLRVTTPAAARGTTVLPGRWPAKPRSVTVDDRVLLARITKL
ncbi:MAG: M1 family metallopeptidase, partial [Gemmatimonadaceae bacterium]|nr:M1 family metallopeptidase [Gemmatimonadaceae bacterium]